MSYDFLTFGMLRKKVLLMCKKITDLNKSRNGTNRHLIHEQVQTKSLRSKRKKS